MEAEVVRDWLGMGGCGESSALRIRIAQEDLLVFTLDGEPLCMYVSGKVNRGEVKVA